MRFSLSVISLALVCATAVLGKFNLDNELMNRAICKSKTFIHFLSIFTHGSILGQGNTDSSSMPAVGTVVQETNAQLQNSSPQKKLSNISNKLTAFEKSLDGSTTNTKPQENSDTATKTAKQKRNKDAHDEPDEEEPDEEEPDEDEPGEQGGAKKVSVDGKKKKEV